MSAGVIKYDDQIKTQTDNETKPIQEVKSGHFMVSSLDDSTHVPWSKKDSIMERENSDTLLLKSKNTTAKASIVSYRYRSI